MWNSALKFSLAADYCSSLSITYSQLGAKLKWQWGKKDLLPLKPWEKPAKNLQHFDSVFDHCDTSLILFFFFWIWIYWWVLLHPNLVGAFVLILICSCVAMYLLHKCCLVTLLYLVLTYLKWDGCGGGTNLPVGAQYRATNKKTSVQGCFW